MPSFGCFGTRNCTPLPAVGPHPLQSFQVASSGCSFENCEPALAAWAPLIKGPRRELHASDEVTNFQLAKSSFVLHHERRGIPAGLRHSAEKRKPGGVLERLCDESHLAVRQI